MAVLKLNKKSRRRIGINITPFVDVILVLMLLFMVTAPMLNGNIDVDLPESVSAAEINQNQKDPVILTVSKDETIYFMDDIIPVSEIQQKLELITQNNKDARIYVKGDKHASYGSVIGVINMVNEAGFTKVSLVTIPFSGPFSDPYSEASAKKPKEKINKSEAKPLTFDKSTSIKKSIEQDVNYIGQASTNNNIKELNENVWM